MNPAKLSDEECDIEQLFGVIDKGTQTSNTHISNECKATPIVTTHEAQDPDKGSIKVFEFTQVVQGSDSPKSITIIRESLTEEIHEHENNVLSDDGTSNRYRYCREVIKPYLNTFPESEANLHKNALDSANQEYPDCIDKNSKNVNRSNTDALKVSSGLNKYISRQDSKTSKTKDCSQSTISKVDALCSPMESSKAAEQKNSKTGKDEKNAKACNEEKKSKSTNDCKLDKKDSGMTLKKPVSKDPCKIEEKGSSTKLKCPVPKDPCRIDETKPHAGTVVITKRSSTKSADIPKSSSSRRESAFGVLPSTNPEERPSFYESSNESSNESSSADSGKSQDQLQPFINQETISTIKTAVEGFFTKVYRTTHEAVTLIKSESAKQLEKIRRTESSNTTTSTASQKSKEEGTGIFNFFRKIEGKQEDSTSANSETSVESLPEVFGKIVEKVDSALSMISDKFSESVPNIFKFRSYDDMSSSYDEPQPPKPVANDMVTPQQQPQSTMFMAMKSRICSMFCEGGECRETLSLNQSNRVTTQSSSASTLPINDEEDTRSVSDKVSD